MIGTGESEVRMIEPIEKSVTPTGRYVGVGNRRVHLPVTVHSETVARLDALCVKFQSSRGRLIDKLVDVLRVAYETGECRCIDGRDCAIHRKDLPGVF